MSNDEAAVRELWAGMDPENQGIDTVIITDHASATGFSPYTVYDFNGERDWTNMARIANTDIRNFDLRDIDTLLLLGCSTAGTPPEGSEIICSTRSCSNSHWS